MPSPFPSSSLTRRHLLRQAFFYSAAAALGSRATALPPPPPAASGDLHFLMLGDFGARGRKPSETVEAGLIGTASQPATPSAFKSTPAPIVPPTPKELAQPNVQPAFGGPSAPAAPAVSKQDAVADAMANYVKNQAIVPEGLFLLGDNFYGAMKGGVSSTRWKEGFEEMYPADTFPGPCWAMLGNHDYDEENAMKLAAELSYADAHPGTRWTMPAKWYRMEWPARDPLITCFILDSNYNNSLVYLTPKEVIKQNTWLRLELEKPRKTAWTLAFGHHPIYSNGPHGDSAALIKDWLPLFQKHGVAAYFCGHDHDLQHLEFDGISTSFVVSGGGGAGLTKLKKPERRIFSQAAHGFTHLQVSRERLIVRHLSHEQKQLHAFSRDPAGRVTILG